MSSIYDLPIEYRDKIDSDWSGQIIGMDNLDSIESDPEEKVIRLSKLVIDMKASEAAIKEEMDRLNGKKKILSANQAMIKEYILGQMLTYDFKHVGDDIVDVVLRRDTGRVEIFDEELLPQEFVSYETVKKIDKSAIKKAFKDGEVEGAILIKDYSIQIK